MPAELLKFIEPIRYFDKFLTEGVFPDGRAIESFKPLSFKRGFAGRGTVVGSAMLKLAGVTVSCMVTASVATVSDAPLTSIKLMAETKVSKKILLEVTDVLDILLSKELFTRRDAHMTTDNRMEWRLTLNVKVLHVDGPVLDAVVAVILAALSDVRLPKVIVTHAVDDESAIEASEVSICEQEANPLQVEAWPVAATFVIYTSKKEDLVLCDSPTDILNVLEKKVEMVTTSKQQIVYVRTRGGDMPEDTLHNVTNIAVQRQREVERAITGQPLRGRAPHGPPSPTRDPRWQRNSLLRKMIRARQIHSHGVGPSSSFYDPASIM